MPNRRGLGLRARLHDGGNLGNLSVAAVLMIFPGGQNWLYSSLLQRKDVACFDFEESDLSTVMSELQSAVSSVQPHA